MCLTDGADWNFLEGVEHCTTSPGLENFNTGYVFANLQYKILKKDATDRQEIYNL